MPFSEILGHGLRRINPKTFPQVKAAFALIAQALDLPACSFPPPFPLPKFTPVSIVVSSEIPMSTLPLSRRYHRPRCSYAIKHQQASNLNVDLFLHMC